MDENEITQRLREAGERPVPGDVRSDHLHRMRAASPARPKRFGRLAVAAAAFVGFAVGSTGFAMAGALPGPAQGVAHQVLSVVQVDVPDRKPNRGACVSAAAEAHPEDEVARKAAKDACPKGRPEGVGKGKPDGVPPGHAGKASGANADGDPCTGKPPWAGPMSPEEKARLRTEDGCGRGPDEADRGGSRSEPPSSGDG
jgi:hypothetical protein